MKYSTVYVSKLQDNGYPFKGKIVFTLESENPVFKSTMEPVVGIFRNGKTQVKLYPNIAISPDMDTYYYWAIYKQEPEDSPNLVGWSLVEEGHCIVPTTSNCLQNILVDKPFAPSGSNCQCNDQPCVVTGWLDWDSYEPSYQYQ